MPTGVKTRKGRPVGTSKTRIELTYRSTGGKVLCSYEEAAYRLGVTPSSLRVYLAHGKGKVVRSIWSDALEAFDMVLVRRIGVDPLTK